ncbi:unnamed protein product [Thlaspi arvense]|uniref:NAC domain-containing protein n=1 Tax=Thlaspi arvense TaxID=13288 RepID=A0AAU9SS87_THLAR|nr:unnamed protein product [Thlaspi arvense]
MENLDLVGYRFYPTGEELINYYLKNKILGKSWLVDDTISEINICSYEPICLPSLSKIESKDPVWYFFSPKEYTSAKKKVTKRTTVSGYWKATGVDRKIKDKRGIRGEIGIKKTLVYYEGRVPNGVWTPWVMHEYHITCLPLHQRTYVICQVMYKGEDGDILYGNNSNEPSHSLVSDSNAVRAINTPSEVEQTGQEDGLSVNELLIPMNEPEPEYGFNPDTFLTDFSPNLQPQTPFDDDEYFSGLLNYNGGNFESVLADHQELIMQENRNDYRPKQSLSGIIVDYSSDSDAESISATSYQRSPGSSNRDLPSCSSTESFKDLIIPSKTEVKQGKAVDAAIYKESYMVKTEKKGWFLVEEAMQRIAPRCVYLMNMIVGFILLVALIGNIVSVLLNVKA